MWGLGWGSGSQTQFTNLNSLNIFILGAFRKFKINNKACTSFEIEKIKLPLTMPHPRADLLPQMPHPGEEKVVKFPTNAQGGGEMHAIGIDRAIILSYHHTAPLTQFYREYTCELTCVGLEG